MKRVLWIPAISCWIAFTSLYIILDRANGLESKGSRITDARPTARSNNLRRDRVSLDEMKDAARAVRDLCDQFTERQRDWELSQHHLFSRARPSDIQRTTAEYAMVDERSEQDETFRLATIVVHRGKETRTLPCIVDARSTEVMLFDDAKWMTGEQWLSTVPSPVRTGPARRERR